MRCGLCSAFNGDGYRCCKIVRWRRVALILVEAIVMDETVVRYGGLLGRGNLFDRLNAHPSVVVTGFWGGGRLCSVGNDDVERLSRSGNHSSCPPPTILPP